MRFTLLKLKKINNERTNPPITGFMVKILMVPPPQHPPITTINHLMAVRPQANPGMGRSFTTSWIIDQKWVKQTETCTYSNSVIAGFRWRPHGFTVKATSAVTFTFFCKWIEATERAQSDWDSVRMNVPACHFSREIVAAYWLWSALLGLTNNCKLTLLLLPLAFVIVLVLTGMLAES